MNSTQSNKSEYLSTVDRLYDLSEKLKTQDFVINLYINRLWRKGIQVPDQCLAASSEHQRYAKVEKHLREKLRKVEKEEELWKRRANELTTKLLGLATLQHQNPPGNVRENPIFNQQFQTMVEDFNEEEKDKVEINKNISKLEKQIEKSKKLLSSAVSSTEPQDEKLRRLAIERKAAVDSAPSGTQVYQDTLDQK
ncbi:unnamed protein product [Dimorphilus gyrociliatus]|uniref:Uncharacterized protein n=1 Tax=Dimorphilus gyrociliatus TaxID=2664684 RepID=A0A7I8VYU9_9ANNE|nr:unnamed protein product [Dimorphilus gyrociliatus]